MNAMNPNFTTTALRSTFSTERLAPGAGEEQSPSSPAYEDFLSVPYIGIDGNLYANHRDGTIYVANEDGRLNGISYDDWNPGMNLSWFSENAICVAARNGAFYVVGNDCTRARLAAETQQNIAASMVPSPAILGLKEAQALGLDGDHINQDLDVQFAREPRVLG